MSKLTKVNLTINVVWEDGEIADLIPFSGEGYAIRNWRDEDNPYLGQLIATERALDDLLHQVRAERNIVQRIAK